MPENSPLSLYEVLFDTLMGHHYQAAEELCSQMNEIWPSHPAVDYGRASIIYAQLCDFEDTTGTAELERQAEFCLQKCKFWNELASDSAEAEREYLTGAAYSVVGLARHRQGRAIDGIRRLMASRNHFDRAIRVDADFFDAYVGRGAYRYAAASNLGFLRWLPIVPTKRDGWSDLMIGLTQSKFSRFAALSAMVWLALQEENFVLADSMVQAGLERFPDSRTFLMPRLSLEKKTGRWEDARNTAEKMLSLYLQLEENNGYEVIGLYRTLMECSDMLGESEAALSFARAGLAANATPYALERRKDTLDDLRARLAQEDSH